MTQDPAFDFGYSQELLESILNVGSDYICVKDREGRFVYLNALDASLYEATPQEVIGNTTEPWVGREQFLEWYRSDLAVMDSGQKEHRPVYSRTGKDGVTHWLDTVKVPFKESPGGRDLLLIIHRDVTSLKKAEDERAMLLQQVAASQKMETIGLLAASVAHDFNNMLTVILASSRLLTEDAGLHADANFLSQSITKAAERAAEVVTRLLVLARKDPVVRSDFDLNRRLVEIKQLLVSVLGEKIDLRLELASEPLCIEGNPSRIEQAVINLIINARDAMPQGGTIVIGTSRETGGDGRERVVLAIRDTGHGMDAETKQKVFEPFYTTKPVGQGTGLGLVVVKTIVEQHEGSLDFESEPDRGAAFFLRFPRLQAIRSESAAKPPELQARLEGKVVLLAEDEELLQILISRSLGALGVRVIKAGNGVAAWNLFIELKDQVDCLITDVVMPGEMDGVTLRRKIAEERPEIPAIIMSGHSFDYLGDKSSLPENTEFLPKPFPIRVLNEKLFALLGASNRPAELPPVGR